MRFHFLEPTLGPGILPPVSSKKEQAIASFEEGLGKLEKIVGEMEEGNLPLERLITHYEKGNQLLAQCDAKLRDAEKKIEILKAKSGSSPQFEKLPDPQ